MGDGGDAKDSEESLEGVDVAGGFHSCGESRGGGDGGDGGAVAAGGGDGSAAAAGFFAGAVGGVVLTKSLVGPLGVGGGVLLLFSLLSLLFFLS